MARPAFGADRPAAYAVGELVRVRRAYPIGHCRTPHYLRGATGTIERYCGAFANPEELAYRRDGLPEMPLYRVRVMLRDLWENYTGPDTDSVEVEVFEHWLDPLQEVRPDA